MRDSLGQRVFRWQIGVLLGDGEYRAPFRDAMTPRLAMVDIMRQLRREGRTGYRMIGYRQIGISGAAVTEWVDFHPIVLDDETDA